MALRNPFAKAWRRGLRSAQRRHVQAVRKLLRAATAPAKPRRPRPKAPPVTPVQLRSFTAAAGQRDYRLYVPALGRRKPRGLVIMLHGCAQDAEDFARGTRMDAHAQAAGLLVAYPQQPKRANGHACWNWFLPAHQQRGKGEPAILAGIARSLMREFGLERRQVFLAGLSAGGAMAAVLAAEYGELFAAVGIHSGLAAGSARNASTAMAVMRGELADAVTPAPAHPAVRCILFQGAADHTVAAINAARLLAAVVPPGASRQTLEGTAGGRRYSRTLVAAAGGLLAESWLIHGSGHAWSGGDPRGSYADPRGPDASAEMLRFFLQG